MSNNKIDLEEIKKTVKPSDGKFSEDEKELFKQIVVHEAYSAAYKVKLATVVLAKGAKFAGAAALKGGTALKNKVGAMLEERKKHQHKK
jgi:hypothetical protein